MAFFLQCNSKVEFGMDHVTEMEEVVAAYNINCPHSPTALNNLSISIKSNHGCSPLLLACHYGDLTSVKRIVEFWGADVNQAATYYFDPTFETKNDKYWQIEKATPLFVAANRGHAEIVQYLVKKGADVSVKTSNEALALFNGLTPLYAVLSPYRHLKQWLSFSEECKDRCSIARFLLESGANVSPDTTRLPSPIWKGTFCRIEALTALIDYGMNVNRIDPNDPKEKTILEYWLELFGFDPIEMEQEELLAVVKLLLDSGAHLHSKNAKGFTAIFQAADSQNLKVLDYLLERSDISRSEKIDSLELAGAVILGNFTNTCPLLRAKAYEYWRQSLHLRQGEGSQKNLTVVRLAEWKTPEELEQVIHQHQGADQGIQSFLVQLRIFSAKSWDAVSDLFQLCSDENDDGFILFQLVEQSRFVDALEILWIMLETIRSFHPRERGLWLTTLKVVGTLMGILTEKMERNNPLLNADTIKTSLELILATDQFHLNNREFVHDLYLRFHMDTLLRLITMLAGLPRLMDAESMEYLSELVRRDDRRDPNFGALLLHKASQNFRRINMFPTVILLLRAGADPNAGDFKGNGPLHYLAEYNPIEEDVARLLLASGAHLDRVNKERKTPADVWKEKYAAGHDPNAAQMSHQQQLPCWLRGVPKLQCLCAGVICSHGVPFVHVMPPSLHPFINLH